jgi:hypothetical protein
MIVPKSVGDIVLENRPIESEMVIGRGAKLSTIITTQNPKLAGETRER